MHRPEKFAGLLRDEISQIVSYELDDPRLDAVTVTDVRVSENLRDASIYVTVAGDEREVLDALAALRHAQNHVRRELSFALGLRHAPELHFVRDTVEEKGARVDQLLEEIKSASSSHSDDAQST